MTDSLQPSVGDDNVDLIEFAAVYALDAVTDAERRDIDARLAMADPDVAVAFRRRIRSVGETMAQLSHATEVEPPEEVRDYLVALTSDDSDAPDAPVDLATRRTRRRRNFVLAAAAAVIIAVGGTGIATQMSQDTAPTAAQILAADDVQTTSRTIGGSGTATVVYSKDIDAGVLTMNNVDPPAEGTVYQMWLLGPSGATSAGTMAPEDVVPSTTAVLEDISDATALGFSVEPTGGSAKPSTLFAQLPL